jgi:hypothetical protein
VIVFNASRVDDDFQQVAYGINQNMPFPSVDLLACVITALAPCFHCFDALGINHPCGEVVCVFRRNRPRVPGMSSTSRSEATLARTLYTQVVGMGKGESTLRRDSPRRLSR